MVYMLGVFMGYLLGRSMRKTPITYKTVRMTAEEAINVIESTEEVNKLKRELHL